MSTVLELKPSQVWGYYNKCHRGRTIDTLVWDDGVRAAADGAWVEALGGPRGLANFLGTSEVPILLESPTERYAGVIIDEVIGADDKCRFRAGFASR